ncbi:MAG: zinc ribbon domain-containing protein [Azoarcus sp.]|nr:zinc ribbon domain-containing protein [Azoarcus sp.]
MSQRQPEQDTYRAHLWRVAEALRNEKALFVLLATGLLTGGAIFLGNSLTGSGVFTTRTLSVFVSLLILPVGGATAGLLLMDQACGRETRSIGQAVRSSIPAGLRLIAVFLGCAAVMAAFVLFLYPLLFVSRIPVAGPALYAVLFPLLSLAAGLLFFGSCVTLSVTGPAIWNGATAREALSVFARLVAERGAKLLAHLLALALFKVLALIALSSIVALGSLTVLNVSTSVLGGSAPLPGLALSSEYTLALAFGGMLAVTLVSTAVAALTLMGLNLIYLRLAGDLPPARTDAPRNLREKKEPARPPAATRTMDDAPRNTAATPGIGGGEPDILASILAEATFAATPAATTCSHCRTIVQPHDRFCGECGGKLQG